MGFLGQRNTIRTSGGMVRAERLARDKDEGLEPLLVVLIEEVRLLRQELSDERDRARQEAERPRGR